jgi:hypothetical protein
VGLAIGIETAVPALVAVAVAFGPDSVRYLGGLDGFEPGDVQSVVSCRRRGSERGVCPTGVCAPGRKRRLADVVAEREREPDSRPFGGDAAEHVGVPTEGDKGSSRFGKRYRPERALDRHRRSRGTSFRADRRERE